MKTYLVALVAILIVSKQIWTMQPSPTPNEWPPKGARLLTVFTRSETPPPPAPPSTPNRAQSAPAVLEDDYEDGIFCPDCLDKDNTIKVLRAEIAHLTKYVHESYWLQRGQ